MWRTSFTGERCGVLTRADCPDRVEAGTGRPHFTYMAYSEGTDHLVLATDDHHTSVFAYSLSANSLRAVTRYAAAVTPFPGCGLAVGCAGAGNTDEYVFVSEARYDHVVRVRVVCPGAATATEASGVGGDHDEMRGLDPPLVHTEFWFEHAGRIGDEGSEEMCNPEQLALCSEHDELWAVRWSETGGMGDHFVTAVRASTGEQLGVIPAEDLDSINIWGLAVSPEEVFIGVRPRTTGVSEVRVFSRSERVTDPHEVEEKPECMGYAPRRRFDWVCSETGLTWSDNLLFAASGSVVAVLDPAGGQVLRQIAAGDGICAVAVCSRINAAENTAAVELRRTWARCRALVVHGRAACSSAALLRFASNDFPPELFQRVVKMACPFEPAVLATLDTQGTLQLLC